MKLKGRDIAKLYITNTIGKKCCLKKWTKYEKLTKLYELGESKIEKELDIIWIMNTLRNVKIILRNSMMSDEVVEQMKHTKKNLINLDTSHELSSNSADENFQDINEDLDLEKINRTRKTHMKKAH